MLLQGGDFAPQGTLGNVWRLLQWTGQEREGLAAATTELGPTCQQRQGWDTFFWHEARAWAS